MLFDEVIWPALVLCVVLLAIWRAKSFFRRLVRALDWVGANISEGLAVVLKMICALLIGFVFLYFMVTSVQMLILKPAVFGRCLPDRGIAERVLKCLVGDPYRHIERSGN